MLSRGQVSRRVLCCRHTIVTFGKKKNSILHTHSLCCICHIATCLSLPVFSLSPCVIFPQPVFSLLLSVFSFPSPCGFFPSFLCYLPSPLFLLLSLCFLSCFPIFLPSLCNFPTLPVSSSPSLCAVEVPASAIRRRGRQVVRMGSSFSKDQTIFLDTLHGKGNVCLPSVRVRTPSVQFPVQLLQ